MDLSALYHHQQLLSLAHLDLPFTPLEVHHAVTQLAPNKASGPDGLPNEFIKHQWSVLQPHLMHIIDQFSLEQADFKSINEARIILVPKVDSPTSVSDYRPISLINSLPKLISKILANRIKPLMTDLVDAHKTAFVQGRYIAKNFLAAREVLHHVHRGRFPAVLLKLDFAKAFDTLNWEFLLQVMAARGFPPRFIRWISHLLSTSSSRIQVNGHLSPSFKHKRGLRQGDPLSPYLFILAADVFQQMTKAVSAVIPHQLSPKLSQPVINFQYADDTILIVSAAGSTIRSVLLVIHCFGQSSGLQVNFSKSSFIPLSIPDHLLQPLSLLLACRHQTFPITYLGMPLSTKAPRREHFAQILQKLECRLEGWKARFISRAGKLQLVRSVLSTIPTYLMSCFRFPKWLISRIDSLRRHFLWTRTETAKPIHLLNWRAVCLPIVNGGLGVLDLHLQNIAFLLRWWWRIYASDDSLWSTYAPTIYALTPLGHRPLILSSTGSFFWRSLLKIKPIFHSSVRIVLLSGQQTSFWFDSWAGQPLILSRSGPLIRRTISVYQAITCFHQLLPSPLTLQHHEAYQRINLLNPNQAADRVVWNLSATGSFTVKSIYTVLSQGGKTRAPFSSIWKAKVTPSMRLFFFFLLKNRLLTHDVMLARNLPHNPGCVMCSQSIPESALHLFFQCPAATAIWDFLSNATGYNLVQTKESPLLTYLQSMPTDKVTRHTWLISIITSTWMIWRERNSRIFRHKVTPISTLIAKILQESDLCLKHC